MSKAHVGPGVKLSAVVIRACDKCQGKRELGKPCVNCGNRKAPVVKDLGVIATRETTRWAYWKWILWGSPAAQRRIKKTNKEQLKRNLGECD
jgi:hypothetical protein